MGVLSDDLRDMGYELTERESPFDENGRLWTKGYELVCDETGIVIDRETEVDTSFPGAKRKSYRESVHRYRNSGKMKLIGGFVSSYDWGESEGRFTY